VNDLDNPEWLALLAAIRAAPADDLPRLVAADWLEENGAPERAELIRVQCELEKVPPFESCHAFAVNMRSGERCGRCDRCCQQDELRRRERELFMTVFRESKELFGTGELTYCLHGSARANGEVGPDTLPLAVVRRGFVDEVRYPAAVWWGRDVRAVPG
jgi:uncharacterized protein (TIGR02996 family)